MLSNLTGADFSATLLAPTAQPPTQVVWNGFTANWNAHPGADTYFLDVATDAGFTHFLEGYENKDIGAVTSYAVSGLAAHTQYYYRVRASIDGVLSAYSETITVRTAIPIFLPLVLGPIIP